MRIYFSAPLFTTAERDWNAQVARALRAAGHEVFLPQEKKPGLDGPGIFAADMAGIESAECLVCVVEGSDPDSGTSWEVGYAYGAGKPTILVRTDIRAFAGSAGEYNAMLMQSASLRIDLPGASTDEVAAALIDALAKLASGPR